MDKLPLVSVVMITYNHEAFIEEAIRGVLIQNCNFQIEFIISNDKSTDRTAEVITKVLKENPTPIDVKVFNHEKNKGVSGNFIWALNQAQGKYIAYCEGDDFWTDPLKLKKQVDFLETNPDYVVTCHNAKVINPEGRILKLKKSPKLTKNKSYSQMDLKKGMHLLTLTLVFRNGNFKGKFGKYYNKVLNADTYLISCLGFYGKGMFLENVQDAAYRDHSGGVWSGKSDFFKFKNLINTYNQLYKLHSDEKSEEKVLLYFKSLLSRLSHKMILNADKNVSFKEFRDSIPIYLMHSAQPNKLIILKSFLLLIYRKLRLNLIRKKIF